MNVWMVGRMLDDGTKQVVTDDAGNAKGFRTEDEAKQFIADGNLGPKSFAFEVLDLTSGCVQER